jgi:hypothetical protein
LLRALVFGLEGEGGLDHPPSLDVEGDGAFAVEALGLDGAALEGDLDLALELDA